MKDWLLAVCVYVPAYFIAMWLARHFDPLFVGWICGALAVNLRLGVPWLRADGRIFR